MSNFVYDAAPAGALDGSVRWRRTRIKAVLIDTAIYAGLVTHTNVAQIPANAILSYSVGLTGLHTGLSGGLSNVFTWYGINVTVSGMVVYQDASAPASTVLLAYYDTIVGFPASPAGHDVTIQWDGAALIV